MLEFTIGPYLYVVDAGGSPGSAPQARWKQGVKETYTYARRKTPS